MSRFVPCAGRSACTEDGSHCRACGRSHVEIAATRRVTGELADLIATYGYENVDEFLAYVNAKVKKKVAAAAAAT